MEEVTAKDISPFCINTKPNRGGVTFACDWQSLYKVNLHSRTGMYALISLLEFTAGNPNELYQKTTDYPWYEWIAHDTPIAIRTRGKSREFSNTNLLTLKVKDAIVDSIRRKTKRRPNIDKENPTFSIFVFVNGKNFKLFLNSSGESLSKRGYREKIHKAALNEALAAGLILLSGWKPSQPFYDPMCGSGTLPIEAAMIGRNIPAGYYRKGFAFQKWKNFNPRIWNYILKEARKKINLNLLRIFGSDNVGANINFASQNVRKLIFQQWIKLKKKDFIDFQPEEKGGIILMNPPYGHRISEEKELMPLYQAIGEVLKKYCVNLDAFIFTGNKELSHQIGLKAKRRYMLKNGKIDCRLLHFPIRAGNYVE